MAFTRREIVAAVVVLLTMAISGNALAAGVGGLELARWNAVPLTDEAMEQVTGEGWQAAARVVGEFIVSTIISLELERAGVFDLYSEFRDWLSETVAAMDEAAERSQQYAHLNPRDPSNWSGTCTRCDAYRQYREMQGN